MFKSREQWGYIFELNVIIPCYAEFEACKRDSMFIFEQQKGHQICYFFYLPIYPSRLPHGHWPEQPYHNAQYQ